MSLRKWLRNAAFIIAFCGAPEAAFSEEACPSAVTASRLRILQIYGRDLETPVREIHGKTKANSLGWTISRCLKLYYVVEVPDLGRALVRKDDVETNLPSADERPVCDANAIIKDSESQNRSAMSSGGRFCR